MTEVQGFSENALRILKARYFLKNDKGEFLDKSPADLFRRVAGAVASAERTAKDKAVWSKAFFEAMMAREFLPNSPTLTGAGRDMCLSACFVLPIEDSMESIFGTVKNAALVHKEGGGTGFDFSRLRPSGSFVHRTQGVASGPVSFLKVIDAATEAVKQGGTRRGANMGILRVDHPDIEKFILMKRDGKSVGNFNISVAVTDAFMEALRKGTTYDVIDPYTKKVAERREARKIFRMIVESAWAIGDPGLIFIDRVNQANPTRGLGPIEATNPCGEQPLHPYESCNLGSINVAAFFDAGRSDLFDWERFGATAAMAVRFLDDVIEVNKYPLPEIEATTKGNRRIGLGIMGWADLLIRMKIRYDSAEALALADKLAGFLRERAAAASEALAKTRGSFPNIAKSVYKGRKMRNATVLTIAPTGTIARIAGCSSSRRARLRLRVHQPHHRRQAQGRPSALRGVGPASCRPDAAAVLRHGPRDRPRVAYPDPGRLPEARRQRRLQDHQPAARGGAEGRREGLPPGLRAGDQGHHHLPRRLPRGAGPEQGRRGGQAPARRAARHPELDHRQDQDGLREPLRHDHLLPREAVRGLRLDRQERLLDHGRRRGHRPADQPGPAHAGSIPRRSSARSRASAAPTRSSPRAGWSLPSPTPWPRSWSGISATARTATATWARPCAGRAGPPCPTRSARPAPTAAGAGVRSGRADWRARKYSFS